VAFYFGSWMTLTNGLLMRSTPNLRARRNKANAVINSSTTGF